MSHVLRFGSAVTNHETLQKACDRMRADGLAVTGPRWVTNHPRTQSDQGTIDGYAVLLPGWRSECVFVCDESGEMVADNFSPYFDYRQIDPLTGERVDGTGSVHADVLAGRKRVGEDGRWGDIRFLDRLNMEYRAVVVEEAAQQNGAAISYRALNEDCSEMKLVLDIPESLV